MRQLKLVAIIATVTTIFFFRKTGINSITKKVKSLPSRAKETLNKRRIVENEDIATTTDAEESIMKDVAVEAV